MLRIQLKATTEAEARQAQASVIKALQNVTEDGLMPSVTVDRQFEIDPIFNLEVKF